MAVSDAHVFPGFLTSVLTQPYFPKPHTSAEERKFASTRDQTQNHESDTLTTEPRAGPVTDEQSLTTMNLTQSPLSQLCKACDRWTDKMDEQTDRWTWVEQYAPRSFNAGAYKNCHKKQPNTFRNNKIADLYKSEDLKITAFNDPEEDDF